MKIGIFLPELRPDRGGAFTFVETVIAGLAGASDDVTIFHYGSPVQLDGVSTACLAATPLGRAARKLWFQEIAARLQRPLHMASALLDRALPYPSGSPLDHAARARGIDLMWFPTPMYEPVDMPYVVTIWDLEHRAHPYFPELASHGEWQARERAFADAVQRATFVVTGTIVGKQEILRYYGVDEDRVRILPHPTPTFAVEAPPGSLALVVPKPYVLYPAQFWSHKNHIGLVDALAELEHRGTIVHAAFVGSDKGNLAHVKAHASSLGIADQIHFLGFVDRPQLVALYRNAAALAYVSLCGPENLPPLEAMALDCPVIASDIAGAREQLGESALLCDTLDRSALASAIERVLMELELREELIAKGKARAARYTQREFGRDLRAMIDEFRRRRALWRD